jgi:glutamine synthetase
MDQQRLQSLEAAGVRFVRVVWCDNASMIRAKAVHIGRLAAIQEHGIGLTAGNQGVPVMADTVLPESGLGPVGEVRLMPDWDTLALLPYAERQARVLADMVQNGQPWPFCPRAFLKRMIADLARDGIQAQAAFENEFYLLRLGAGGIEPVDDTTFASTRSMDLNRAVIDDIAAALLAQDIPVEQYYPEAGPGQQEISISHTHALAAADRQIAFRETVRAVAQRHQLRASFLPKIFADQPGSGCHLHLSLWRDGRNLFAEPRGGGGLSPLGLAFVAGLLEHLPALMALTTPSPNSYRRLRPHTWAGAFRCWGPDNREAAVRVPTDPAGGGSSQIELKTVDATANPYLALGAVLAAGLDGIRRNLRPPAPVTADPGLLPPEQMLAQQIELLPQNLAASLQWLERDGVLLAALGRDLARAFLAVRRAEWEAMKGMDLADEVKLLLERY